MINPRDLKPIFLIVFWLIALKLSIFMIASLAFVLENNLGVDGRLFFITAWAVVFTPFSFYCLSILMDNF